jgi:hypothetical protein
MIGGAALSVRAGEGAGERAQSGRVVGPRAQLGRASEHVRESTGALSGHVAGPSRGRRGEAARETGFSFSYFKNVNRFSFNYFVVNYLGF